MNEKLRVLFVDDEPEILSGLRDLLRRERKVWDLVFANGGEAGLAELAKAPFDVVVSDMRMPGMDGCSFLTAVRAQCPQALRVVLSGHAERDAVLQVAGVAQQYLSKPCEAMLLKATLVRADESRKLLANDELRGWIGSLKRLPSAPTTYLELAAIAGSPSAGVDDFARVAEKDPAMCSKLLQFVNSAYFGAPRRILSVRDAVSFLGIELVKALSIAAHVFGADDVDQGPVAFRDHGFQTATLARTFLRGTPSADEAFTMGLLHDVGEFVLARSKPDEFAQVLEAAAQTPQCDGERERFGVTHGEVGAYLLALWGLPSALVGVVAHHHAPRAAPESCPRGVLAAVHLASALVQGEAFDRSFLEEAIGAEPLTHWLSLPSAKPFADKLARPEAA